MSARVLMCSRSWQRYEFGNCGCSCEKLQASCDEAVSNSERHQAALTKQVDANKVLDNDLKMMCACLTLTTHATCT